MIYSTKYKDMLVDIKIGKLKDQGFYIRGVALKADSRLKFDGISQKKRTALTEAKIPATCRKVIFDLEQQYATTVQQQAETAPLYERVSDYLDTLLNKVDSEGVRIVPAWAAPSTNHGVITYFQKHVLAWLRPFLTGEKQFLPETDSEELRRLIADDVSSSNKTVNGTTIEKTVAKHMHDASYVLDYLYRSGLGIPLISLVLDKSPASLPGNEMLKTIPSDIFERFCHKLYEEAEQHPGAVLCAVIMAHGARTSEAAAVRMKDITIKANHSNVTIFQQESNRVRVSILKTVPSRRVMLLGEWGTHIVQICAKYLDDDGTGEHCYLSAEELNDYVVILLREAGMDAAAIRVLMEDMNLDAVNNASDKLSSYILRRNFASLCRNIMGFTLEELDAQLGHKNGINMRQADVRDRMVMKLNRFRFDRAICPDSWGAPISFDGYDTLDVDQFKGYKLRNSLLKPITLQITVTAREAGEPVDIGWEEESTGDLQSYYNKADWSTVDRIVLGDLGGD